MEEILHHLIGSLSHYLQDFVHPRWLFVISSINNIKGHFLLLISSSINFDPFTVYPPDKEPTRPENSRFCDRNKCFNLVHPSVEGTKNITSW